MTPESCEWCGGPPDSTFEEEPHLIEVGEFMDGSTAWWCNACLNAHTIDRFGVLPYGSPSEFERRKDMYSNDPDHR